jgi:hypothetical protein
MSDIKDEKKAYLDRIEELSEKEGQRYNFPHKFL